MKVHFIYTVTREASGLTETEKANLTNIADALAVKLIARGYRVGTAFASADYVRVNSMEIAPGTWGDSAAIEYRYVKEDTMKIRNINECFGESIEFETVEEMAAAIVASGYEIPEDGLREGRDYERR